MGRKPASDGFALDGLMDSHFNRTQLQSVLDRGSWFSHLPLDIREGMLLHGRLRRLKDGEVLFNEGDVCNGLYAVILGTVLIRPEQAVARERPVMVAAVESPNWFGEISVIDGLPRTHDAVAQGDVVLWWLPGYLLEDWLHQQPVLWRYLAMLVSYKTRIAFKKIQTLAAGTARTKVVQELLLLGSNYHGTENPDDPTGGRIALTQRQLGALTGLSRQTINEVLHQLEMDGSIALHKDCIEILLPQKMRLMP